MTTDLFIRICSRMMKVSKTVKGHSYPFEDLDERQTARRFFIDKGVEVAYEKDETQRTESTDPCGCRIVIQEGKSPLYVLHAYDDNGYVKTMSRENAEDVQTELKDKGIDCLIETIGGRQATYSPPQAPELPLPDTATKPKEPVLEDGEPQKSDIAIPATELHEVDQAEALAKIERSYQSVTRRNMKDCVTAVVREKCREDKSFAAKVMNPKKDMGKCFRYITEKALEWLTEELKTRGEAIDGDIGDDVPDDLCYQWSIEYFMMELPEESDKPKTLPIQATKPNGKTKTKKSAKDQPTKKQEPSLQMKPAKNPKPESAAEQISLFD